MYETTRMFEWQRASDSDASFDLITDERRQWQPPQHWRLWLAGILVLCLAAGVFLYWRLAKRTAAMRTDVERFVQYEAAQRRLGPAANVAGLLDPTAPNVWTSSYVDTMMPASDTTMRIDTIEFYKTRAVVTLRSEGQRYVQVYRLVDQEWRRTPATTHAWGGLRMAQLASNLTIRYHERDSAFVGRLLKDVPALIREHPLRSGLKEVIIQPEEFGPALLQRSTERVVLNSPLLTTEQAARQALADTLTTGPPPLPTPTPAPAYKPVYPPFDATVASVNQETGRVLVEIAGWDTPAELHAGAADLIGPDGTALPAGCAGLYHRFTIEAGAWRIPGEAITATRITVGDAAPSAAVSRAAFPPLSGTVALLLRPTQHSGTAPSYTVLAVTQDGRTRELATYTSLHPIWPAQPADTSPLLLAYTVPGCEQSWFFLYDPQQGITKRWLSRSGWQFGNAAQLVWQPRKKDTLLFVWPRQQPNLAISRSVVDAQRDSVLNTSRLLLVDQFGTFTRDTWSPDWRTDLSRHVALADAASEVELSLVDVLLGDTQIPTGARMALSSDGRHVFYTTDGATPSLSMLDLTSGATTFILYGAAGERLQPLNGGNAATRSLVLVRSNSGSRLLAVNPLQPHNSPEVVAETTGSEQISGAIVCDPTRIFYVIARDDQFHVFMWKAGTAATQLITSDSALLPWACRSNPT